MFNRETAMPLPPDGPEERAAAAQEQSWIDDDRLSRDEQFADESRDDPEQWS